MTWSKYKVGHWIKDEMYFAKAELIYHQTINLFKEKRERFEMLINFKDEYYKADLDNMNIKLPFYSKSGKYKWSMHLKTVAEVRPELQRLSTIGFDIDLDNEEVTRLIAKLV